MRNRAPGRSAARCALAAAAWAAWPLAAGAQELSHATLYGRINLDVEYISARKPDGGDAPSQARLSSNSSRLGVRGGEYVGGGMVAVWQIESGISTDTGGGGIATRDTFIGLEGDWGGVKFGNFLAPYDDLHPIFGNVPTLTTSILSTAALWSQGTLSKTAGGFDARLPNSLRYDAPDLNGFEASAQVSLGEDERRSAVYGVGATYTNGPFEGGIAYEYNRKVRGPDFNDHAFSAVAAWDFGVVRLAGVYEKLRYGTPVGPLRRNFYAMSGTVPTANSGVVYAFVGYADEGKAAQDVRVGGLTNGAESSAWQYALSYTYTLSRRTLVYAGFVRIENDDRAAYNFNINPYTADAPTGLKLNGFVLGAAHFF
jgi:predicted porin